MNPDPASLDRLHDIMAPPPAPWWPPAPGWYVVLGAAILILLALAFRAFIRWQHARYRRHQLMILHLLDRAEIELPYDKPITLMDLETDDKIEIDPADLRDTFTQQVNTFLDGVRKACSDSGAEYHKLFVDVPYERALVSLMNRR